MEALENEICQGTVPPSSVIELIRRLDGTVAEQNAEICRLRSILDYYKRTRVLLADE